MISPNTAKTLDDVAQIVAKVAGCPTDDVGSGASLPLFCYCAYIVLGFRQSDIATYLGFSGNGNVSKALKKSHRLEACNAYYREMLQVAVETCME
jgi:hypothetical protein